MVRVSLLLRRKIASSRSIDRTTGKRTRMYVHHLSMHTLIKRAVNLTRVIRVTRVLCSGATQGWCELFGSLAEETLETRFSVLCESLWVLRQRKYTCKKACRKILEKFLNVKLETDSLFPGLRRRLRTSVLIDVLFGYA